MSAPSQRSGKLEAFFEVWESVQNVSSLDRASCESSLEFFNKNENSLFVFRDPKNSQLFTEKFGVGEGEGFYIAALIGEKIWNLETRLLKIAPRLDVNVNVTFNTLPLDVQEAFSEYKELPNSEDYASFISLFTSMYALNSMPVPWVFISASSGTGKTQLAFSLPIRRLLFLMDLMSAKEQLVYKPLVEISIVLHQLITEDIFTVAPNEEYSYSRMRNLPSILFLEDDSLCFSGTFILFLIEELQFVDPSEWMTRQFLTPFATKGKRILSIKELREKVALLFPDPRDRPVIFFDECNEMADPARMIFLRGLLRHIGLISVFMGTNADPCKILSKTDSSSLTTSNELYAIVITRLPPISQNKLADFQAELVGLISNAPLDRQAKKCKIRLLSTLFRILQKERPLFVNLIIAHLRSNFCTEPTLFIDLQKLCLHLRNSFMAIKGFDTHEKKVQFIKSQIHLLMRDDWLLFEQPQYLPIDINRHIACLKRPRGLIDEFPGIVSSPDYFPLYSAARECIKYRVKGSAHSLKFEDYTPNSAMPSFSEQPIACLAFTGGLDEEKTFLHPDESNASEVSAMFAFQKYIKEASYTPWDNDLNGRKMQYLGGMSSVLASRVANGSFFKFVERLTYHLSLEGHEWNLLPGQLSDNCSQFLRDFTVPFLAPLASAWDTDLRDLLKVHFQQTSGIPEEKSSELSGGTCKLVPNTEQYNLSIKNGKGYEVIAMEFNLQQDSLSGNDLKLIFDKINSLSTCHTVFIVALDFAAALKKKENWHYLSPNYSIYSLVPVLDTENTLGFANLFPSDGTSAEGQDLRFDLGFEVDLDNDFEVNIFESMDMELDISFKKKKSKKIKRIKRNLNEPLIVILVSLLDLNKFSNKKSFLKAVPCFRGGM